MNSLLFSTFVAITLATNLFLSPTADSQEVQAPIVNTASSFLNYQPTTSAFQPKLKPLTTLIVDAIELANLGEKEKSIERFEAAKNLAETLLSKLSRGYHDELLFLLGFTHEHLGDTTSALSAYQKSVEKKANNPYALFRHANLLKSISRYEEAISEFKEVSWRTDELKYELLHLIGECQLELGLHQKALATLERALALNPYYAPTAKALIKIQLATIETTDDPRIKLEIENRVVQLLRLFVSLNPTDRESAILLVEFILKRSDPFFDAQALENAEALATKLAEESNFKDDSIIQLLFKTQIKQKKLELAEKTLELGLKNKPNSEILHNASTQLEIEKRAIALLQEKKETLSTPR